MAQRIAIVGGGPSGVYCADALLRLDAALRIDIFERRAHAFGLLRCAVAPDHLATKALQKVMERVLSKEYVRLHTGVTVGDSLGLSRLEDDYDAVIVAAGAQAGKRLDIERSTEAASLTALDFAMAFNGCQTASVLPFLDRPISNVCIAGSGNASLDVARLLMTSSADLRKLTVPEAVLDWHQRLQVASIKVIARSAPVAAKFSPNELAALEKFPEFQPVWSNTSGAALAGGPLASVLSRWQPAWNGHGKSVQLCFSLRPEKHAQDTLRCLDQDGKVQSFPCDLLVEAIGQLPTVVAGLPVNVDTGIARHENGRVHGPRATFVTGWSAGQQLNLAGMRESAKATAAQVLQLLASQRTV